MTEPIEQLKELPVPKLNAIPPLDRKYITVGYWRYGDKSFWCFEQFETQEQAQTECKDPNYVPGTLRIFEVPPKERN